MSAASFRFLVRPTAKIAVIALGAGAWLISGGCSRRPPVASKLSFNESIEPILSENCYSCHGPDPGARKASLRVDRPEFAFAPHDKSGPAIIRHDPDHSPLILRVESKDPKQSMPPPEAHKTLRPEEIALLRRWVKEGAEYQEHWAFIAPQRPVVPAVQRPDWPRNDIDRFILARLEREGLEPSPEEDRAELIRRVTYDLSGLPPSPEEVDAFLHDSSSHAYEKVVDRLLASPHYGEHRAHYWLDAARYGDTNGQDLDHIVSLWPYRDYVIRSYNQNKPFDQFVREQLAGDLLPPTNVDQLVATAFVRAGIVCDETGSIVEELRFNNERERSEAFGAVFLGLTTGCAVCHDHKFDPVTQKDFYRLTAFFNNLTEDPFNTRYDPKDNPSGWWPYVNVPLPANSAAFSAAMGRRAAVQRKIAARRESAPELIAAWLSRAGEAPQPVPSDALAVRLRFDEGQGTSLANSAPGAAGAKVTLTGGVPAWGEDTWFWPSFRMETSTRVELPSAGDIEADQAFSTGTWLMPRLITSSTEARVRPPPFGALIARVDSASQNRGWGLYSDKGNLSFRLVHQWPDSAIEVQTAKSVLSRGRWNHVFVTYDGSGKAAGVCLYVDGQAQPVKIIRDSLAGSIRTPVPLGLGRESPDASQLRETRFQDFRYYARCLPAAEAERVAYEDIVAEIVRQPAARWTEDQRKTVGDFYFSHRDEAMPALVADRGKIDAELARLGEGGTPCLICDERPGLAYSNVLARGVYTQRIERVRPGVPHFLPQIPANSPLDRRALAEWVVSPGNPLTARVTVNRMWQEIFGTGLVETTEDFGLVGARPSHPQLLDWLAVDFREHGWDVKRLYKELVMTAAYRQATRITPTLLARDPDNRLLARGPRFRLDAEMIRDTALAVSGLLVDKLGGPPTRPYQPAGVWEAGAYFKVGSPESTTAHYHPDHGDNLYRRSLYTFWKRMATMPNMQAFDEPGRDASCTRRARSDTPLQALVLMNDPQFLEAARSLAERVLRHATTTEARLDYLGRLLLARSWPESDQAKLDEELAKLRSIYADHPDEAAEVIAQGESPPDPKISPTELAPWTLVASAALGLDATLNK